MGAQQNILTFSLIHFRITFNLDIKGFIKENKVIQKVNEY